MSLHSTLIIPREQLIDGWYYKKLQALILLFKNILSVDSEYHKSVDEIKAEFKLIARSKEDPGYFAPLYERYYESIFIYINKRIDSEDITAELTSRVFFNALENIDKYRFQGVPFSAWLYKIAINEINQFFRKQTVFERSVSLNEDHIDLLIDEIDYKEPQLDKYILISVLLEQLSSSELQFLELRFFENRSFKEMGYLLGLSETNAKVKTYRILKKLKKISSEIKYHDS